jgi:site-specific DNA recombinase
MNKLRAVGYCRTSGEGQRDNTSIDNQEKSIEEFCKRNDWKFQKHYVDESKTGSKIEGRDEFQLMLKDAAFEKFDLIVPFDIKRFARDGVDSLTTAKFLKQAYNIHVVDTKGQFDSRSRRNTLLNFVHAGVSEDERISIMERMIGGRISRAKEGKRWSGKTPFGRSFDKATGKWQVTERGRRLKALLERYAAGEGLTNLPKEFTEFRVAETVLGAVRTSQLSGTYVKEFNIPDLDIAGLRIPMPAIPEVITPQLESKVRSRMEHQRRWNRDGLRHYVLTGFVRCGHCGRPLSGNSLGRGKYYRHTYHVTYELPKCVFHSIREDELVEPALNYLYSFFTDQPTFNAAIARALPDQNERQAIEREHNAAQQGLSRVEKEIGRLVNAIVKGADANGA